MPIAAPRRVGVAGLLGLLAGALVLMFAPGNPGALRLLGIGLASGGAAALAPWLALLTVELAQAADTGVPRAPRRAARGRARGEGGARFYRMALRGGGLTLLYTSALGLVALVAIIAGTLVVSPWGAWRDVASRPALTFGERSPWVTDGRTLARPIALDFTEGHRVTALSPATYRVVEPGRFREWQLRPGETLSLRAGDRLVLDAGVRLRFEAGKRIPGAPASGDVWAEPPERGGLASVLEALGTLVTLVGGALALVGSRPTF